MCSEWYQALGVSDPRRPVPSRSASLQGRNPALASVIVNELLLSFLFRVYVFMCIAVETESSGLLW